MLPGTRLPRRNAVAGAMRSGIPAPTVNETVPRRQNKQKNHRFRPLEPKESIHRQNAMNFLFL